jgi:hypothetical protein
MRFIRAGLILFVILLAIYLPLKIYIARTGEPGSGVPDGTALVVFATSDLNGYREPCG